MSGDNNNLMDEAERYRLHGNDAFSTGDWERAAELYTVSLSIDPISKQSAKVYSNMAATLCKVGQYDDVEHAAERATAVDPTWAKGWWRRGVVSELHKNYMRALSQYYNAYSLDKTNKVFLKALRTCSAKVGGKVKLSKGKGGELVLTQMTRMGGVGATVMNSKEEAKKTPGYLCWHKIVPDGFSPERVYYWRMEQAVKPTPSSEQVRNV